MANYAIRAAGFIDLSASAPDLHQNEVLLVEEEAIRGFESSTEIPDGFELLDYSESYCLPSLIDTAFLPALVTVEGKQSSQGYGEAVWHAREAGRIWLQEGVGTVASMGALERLDFDLAQSVNSGRIVGPRLLPALSPLVPIGGANFGPLYGVREVVGVEDARRAARQLIKDGAERIVVYADVPLQFHPDPIETSRERLTFSVEELREIVTQARQAGCFVHAQAVSAQAIENCIVAGVRSIGNAFQINSEQIEAMASQGIALAPNLALGATILELGESLGLDPAAVGMISQQRLSKDRLVEAQKAGVEIICGTNAAFSQGGVIRECVEMEKNGLSNEEVLRAATLNAGRSLKAFTDCGSLLPAYRADLIFLPRNPLEDFTALEEVGAMMLGGQLLEAESLKKEVALG